MKDINWDKAFGKCPKSLEDHIQTVLSELPQPEQEGKMKKLKMRKVALIAVAIMIVSSVGVYASGYLGYIKGSTAIGSEIHDFSKVEQLVKKSDDIKTSAKYLSKFDNGFSFDSGALVNEEAQGDKENQNRKYDALNINYTRGDAEVSQYIQPAIEFLPPSGKTSEYRGLTLYTTKQHYKQVPMNYEKTAEDIKAEQDGSLTFSWIQEGEPVNEFTQQYISWEEDGMLYQLQAIDNKTSADVLMQMAKEIISAGK